MSAARHAQSCLSELYIITMQRATQEGLNDRPLLTCTIPEEDLPRLATMLQAGFFVDGAAGESISSLLQRLPGFSADYIENQIQTVFYNGDAIDDLSQPLIGPAPTIALSAAMPGLAGAILRKNSPAAPLRKTRSQAAAAASDNTAVTVLVKLFNTLAIERGPALFRSGVRIKAADLAGFLSLRPSLLEKTRDIRLAGSPVPADELTQRLAGQTSVIMHVT
ncbi:MAG: hypothetical protein V2J11_04390 [Desulfofustis sp.]|jgi:hypothetical protein|nr:hypothetical protein [Desulfofustis sp.]